MIHTTKYPETKLLNLILLLQLYKQDRLNVRYYNPNSQDDNYISVPPVIDLFVKFRCWINYNPTTDQITVSNNLIGVQNYWITQLLDDHKNKRLNIMDYIYKPPQVNKDDKTI